MKKIFWNVLIVLLGCTAGIFMLVGMIFTALVLLGEGV